MAGLNADCWSVPLDDGVPAPTSIDASYAVTIATDDDSQPPEISNIDPTPGTEIPRSQVIQFDVTDDLGLAAVLVYVRFSGRPTELIHDSDQFEPSYSGSSRDVIAGGFHYTIRRSGGWQSAPTFIARAIDQQGNQNA